MNIVRENKLVWYLGRSRLGYLLTLNLTSVATPTEMRTLVKCRPVLYTECYSIYHGLSPAYLLLSERPADAGFRQVSPPLLTLHPAHPCITLLAALAAPVAATLPFTPILLIVCGLATCRIILIAGCRYFIKCMLSFNPITRVLCMSGLK